MRVHFKRHRDIALQQARIDTRPRFSRDLHTTMSNLAELLESQKAGPHSVLVGGQGFFPVDFHGSFSPQTHTRESVLFSHRRFYTGMTQQYVSRCKMLMQKLLFSDGRRYSQASMKASSDNHEAKPPNPFSPFPYQRLRQHCSDFIHVQALQWHYLAKSVLRFVISASRPDSCR